MSWQLILFLLIGSAVATPFYRTDYQYFHEFDAFYKFDWNYRVTQWLDAFIRCNKEGATLFYPYTDGEFNVVTNLTLAAGSEYNYSDILVGIHDRFRSGEFMTVDGTLTPIPIVANHLQLKIRNHNVLLNINTGEYTISGGEKLNVSKAFICKRQARRLACPTDNEEYVYSPVTRKCYKVSKESKSWEEAYRQCFVEGAMLFVPESAAEYNEVINHFIVVSEQNTKFSFQLMPDFLNHYYIGINHPKGSTEYFTAGGKPMMSANVYQLWESGDSKRLKSDDSHCVVIGDKNSEGLYFYKTVSCVDPRFFICEMNTYF